MAKKPAPPPTPESVKPAGKGKLKLIVLALVVLLLVVGLSVGATWLLLSKRDHGKDDKVEDKTEQAAAVRQPAIYQDLAPAFVVNFNVNGRQRYMQVSVSLMARDQAALDALNVHVPVIRNELVMLFSSQDFSSLTTPVGKEMLRQQATAKVQALAQKETGKPVVEQVLFTNFVLQ
jgi:flagellar FliL protein